MTNPSQAANGIPTESIEDTRRSESLLRAARSAQRLYETVERAIRTNYRDDPVEPGATITVGLLSAVFAGGVYAMLGVGAIAGAIPFIGASIWFGSLFVAGCWSLRRNDAPSIDLFTSAARKLESDTERLSTGPERQLLQQFLNKSRRGFALAEAATLQERIVRANEPVSDLEKAQKTGIAVIEKAAVKGEWADRDSLRTAFTRRELPSTSAYIAELFNENRALQEHISHTARSQRPNLPQRSPPPSGSAPAFGFPRP